MLVELKVRNFAIVEDGALRFSQGLTAFTGETGAGKSLLFDAITLLLGAKARSDLVRTGAATAEVEGVFDLSSNAEQRARLQELGFGLDDEDAGLLIVRRELSAKEVSKNRIWIQGRAATRSQLQDVLGDLVEISGQHEFLKLGREDVLLALLDQYGHLKDEATEVEAHYHRWVAAREELASIETNESGRQARLDYLSFQIEELERAGIHPKLAEEEAELLAVRGRLASVEKLRIACERGLALIDGGESDAGSVPGALSALQNVAREFRPFEALGKDLKDILIKAEELESSANDLRASVQRLSGSLDADPEALENAESRLSLLTRLKRKYSLETEGLCELLTQAKVEHARLNGGDGRVAELRKQVEALNGRLYKVATGLHERRASAASELQKLWEKDIRLLGMNQARLEVQVELGDEPRPRGMTRVQALFSANAGEALKPLGKVASGGELSRIMLALKHIVAGRSEVGVYLFDEVDAGIGGETGGRVALRLKQIAEENQVLVVTHLATIAAHAHSQFLIEKLTEKGRTRTRIEPLVGDARTAEIARMLGGASSKAARELAREMLHGAEA